jgi:hypothetical protein
MILVCQEHWDLMQQAHWDLTVTIAGGAQLNLRAGGN